MVMTCKWCGEFIQYSYPFDLEGKVDGSCHRCVRRKVREILAKAARSLDDPWHLWVDVGGEG